MFTNTKNVNQYNNGNGTTKTRTKYSNSLFKIFKIFFFELRTGKYNASQMRRDQAEELNYARTIQQKNQYLQLEL